MSTTPSCAGRYELFDSTDVRDHLVAITYCDTCPVRDWCEQRTQAAKDAAPGWIHGAALVGTWAGVLYGNANDPVRIASEDAMFTDAEAREAHKAYSHHGDRSDRARIGERVYSRRKRRNQKADAA